MPTVVVIDSSPNVNNTFRRPKCEPYKPLEAAVNTLETILEHIADNTPMEFVSLASYGDSFEVICPFTRDFEKIRKDLLKIKLSNVFKFDRVLKGVEQYILSEWGSGTPCNVLLLVQQEAIPVSYTANLCFPGNLIVFSLTPEDSFMPEIISENPKLKVSIYQPDVLVKSTNILKWAIKVCETFFSPWIGTLQCGHFKSKISLFPPPEPYEQITDFDYNTYSVESLLEICGFIHLKNIGSPGALSRHLVLPYSPISSQMLAHVFGRGQHAESDEDDLDERLNPSFIVLLHGALKVEVMAALVHLTENWYGVLYSWADSKKKCSLMLSILEPGSEPIPWLGNLNHLAIRVPNCEEFPVKALEKKSYASNCVSWIKTSGFTTDIQKILRHARKIPEKTVQFYKELNRVRRAAISLGFIPLIDGLASILERECTSLPGSAHPGCAFQLSHASGILREPYAKDIKYNIIPMKVSF